MNPKLILSAFAAAALVAGCNQNSDQSSAAAGAPSAAVTNGNAIAASNVDNSSISARDQGGTNANALDQGNSNADIQTSAAIRKQVVSSTNNLSMLAQNITIITQNGKVSLRGLVANDTEKTQIDAIAKGVAGDGNVDDGLEVKASPQSQ